LPAVLWCGEAQHAPSPSAALVRQLSDRMAELLGDLWNALVLEVDRAEIVQPVERLTELLKLLEREQFPSLVVYLDQLDALLRGPVDDDPEAAGEWRDADAHALWLALERVQSATRGRVAVVASCRYRHPDLDPYLVPLGGLTDDALFRLMGWFGSLRRLAAENRAALVERLAGHPGAVGGLDTLLASAFQAAEADHGPRPPAGTRDEARAEWKEIVTRALPGRTKLVAPSALLAAIWGRLLDRPARRLLARLAVVRGPWDVELLRALGDPGAPVERV